MILFAFIRVHSRLESFHFFGRDDGGTMPLAR